MNNTNVADSCIWKFKRIPNSQNKDNYKLMLIEYLGDDSVVVIPENIDGHGVTQIGRNVFYRNENITSVIIPDSITNIGVFRKNVEIPAFAFFYCDDLINIYVSKNNKKFASEDGVLYNKTKTDLLRFPHEKKGAFTFPNCVTKIGFNAFSGCATLTKIELPDGVIEIENEAFFDCVGLTIIKIPATVIKIGEWAFFGCDNLKIFCKLGSYAEQYAENNNLLYKSY